MVPVIAEPSVFLVGGVQVSADVPALADRLTRNKSPYRDFIGWVPVIRVDD